MALAALAELRHQIEELGVPEIEVVEQSLNGIAEAIAEGGPEPRQEVVDQFGYYYIAETWKMFCNTHYSRLILSPEAAIIREACLKALYALTAGFPEIIDESAFVMVVQSFNDAMPESTKIQGLKFMRTICFHSESNRELLVDHGVVKPFVGLIKVEHHSGELVREWCGTLRAFVSNDDRRVSYNRAPERKRLVYQHDAHGQLAHFLHVYPDVATLNAIVNALSLMLSNHDFCIAFVESSGGLRGLHHLLENYNFNVRLMKNTMSCIRSLNMCPAARIKCANSTTLLKIVFNVTWTNRTDADFLEIAISCLSFMTLRCPVACEQLLAENDVHSLVALMTVYMNNPFILKNACLTLRNVAVNGGEVGKSTLIEFDVVGLVHQIAAKHPDLIPNHVNPVLRDLGLGPFESVHDLVVPTNPGPDLPADPATVLYQNPQSGPQQPKL